MKGSVLEGLDRLQRAHQTIIKWIAINSHEMGQKISIKSIHTTGFLQRALPEELPTPNLARLMEKLRGITCVHNM
jgi:hypothetical protein